MTRRQNISSIAALAVALAAMPLALSNDYYINVLILGALNAMTALGLNLLMGQAGQISLGHAALVGLSAYTSAILSTTLKLPIPLSMGAGVGAATLAAWLIGIPTLKLKGHYLAMATLGFGLILYIFFNETVELTGGPSGLLGIPRLSVFGYTFTSDTAYYYLTAGVLVALVGLAQNLMNSRLGRALRAIHGSERAAAACGIDVARYKLLIFTLSASFAGVAGALYAHFLTFIAPSSFGFTHSVGLVTMVVIGGTSSIWGSIAGAFFLTALPEMLRAFEEVDILIYGGLLTATILFVPDGLAVTGFRLVRKIFTRKGATTV